MLPIIGKELLEEYEIGDLVTWIHDLSIEKVGIVLDIYPKEMGNRKFPFAKVYIMGEDTHDEKLLANLTKISSKQN
jgi:hypothetical protein